MTACEPHLQDIVHRASFRFFVGGSSTDHHIRTAHSVIRVHRVVYPLHDPRLLGFTPLGWDAPKEQTRRGIALHCQRRIRLRRRPRLPRAPLLSRTLPCNFVTTRRAMIIVGLKLCPPLIQRQRMPKSLDRPIRVGKGQRPLDEHAHARDGVPHAEELDLDVLAVRLLKASAEPDALFVFAFVELVGEGDLGVVSAWKEARFVQEAGEGATDVGASAVAWSMRKYVSERSKGGERERRTEDADAVPAAVVFH